MSARHMDFVAVQTRLKTLGFYSAPIDDEWGPGMAAGIDRALAQLEKLAGIKPEPPALAFSPAKLPVAYAWLRDERQLPRHLTAALSLYGTLETAGAGNNPAIMGWRDACMSEGVDIRGYTGDAVPWCGLFIAYVMVLSGRAKQVVDGPLWALNWSKFGVDGGQPELGDILTFKREGGGHVALYIGEDSAGYYHVLGGNQSDRVNIMRIAKKRMHACRQPAYIDKPSGIRPIIVSAGGAPVSRNEA